MQPSAECRVRKKLSSTALYHNNNTDNPPLPKNMVKFLPALLMLVGSKSQTWAFLSPVSSIAKRQFSSEPLQLARRNDDGTVSTIAHAVTSQSDVSQRRRDFLLQTFGAASIISMFPSIAYAADDDYLYTSGGEDSSGLTSELFNPDGSLRDPNTLVEAKDKAMNVPFCIPTSSDGININVATDGVQQSSTTDATTNNLTASYNLPLKWNQDATSQLPLYYDSSEGKNGKSCNRITVYSVSAPNNLDMSTLEKASKVGVAKSLFMDQIPNKYFDQGALKADLISGRTVRKPIKSLEVEGGVDEQIYYEFDLAFAPSECPDFGEGNKENLGLGFCPYDNIFLVSATVLNNGETGKGGTLMCCIVECNKDEWKIANSDLKRVRSSFALERA